MSKNLASTFLTLSIFSDGQLLHLMQTIALLSFFNVSQLIKKIPKFHKIKTRDFLEDMSPHIKKQVLIRCAAAAACDGSWPFLAMDTMAQLEKN